MLYQIGNFSYNRAKGIIIKGDEELKLTKTQKNLLNYFLDNPKKIISKQTLMEEVWGRIVIENSVDQMVSFLRLHLEKKPTEPEIIITHYGQGISFEGDFKQQTPSDDIATETINTIDVKKPNKSPLLWYALLLMVVLTFVWIKYTRDSNVPEQEHKITGNQQILVLPTNFSGKNLSTIEQVGIESLLKSTFNTLESEGQIIFDQSSLTTKQAVEKHWRLEKDLMFLRTNIVKNGDIYQAVIELTDGTKTLRKTTFSEKNISNLMSQQMLLISDYNNSISKENITRIINQSPDENFIQALGYKNDGNLKLAKELINQVLLKKEDHYLARLTLAKILFEEKAYNKSLSQLKALKATNAYELMGTEIELAISEIKFVKHENIELIDILRNYQANHLGISTVKKSKIKLLMAKAFLALADNENALKYYKQSLLSIDEQLNPLIYAQSYLGQARVLSNQSVGENVFDLFSQALKYAKSAGNIHHQILALNSLSHLSMSSNSWENSITFQKQAIELMELLDNKEKVAVGIETLVTLLNLRGQLSEAKQVNEKLGDLAKELDSDTLRLHYMHFDAILAMNTFDWVHAHTQIDKQLKLAKKINDYSMQLNNAFLALEILLLEKNTEHFRDEWDKREALIQTKGFERFQIYMDLYLARYYKQINKDTEAINLLNKISEQALQTKDIKILVDTQNQLAMVYLKSDANKALKILNNLEQHDPHPNPYLDLKAKALYGLGKSIEALNVLNQAKLIYHESWTTENQILLDTIQNSIK